MACLAVKCLFAVLLLTVVSGSYNAVQCGTREEFNNKYNKHLDPEKLNSPTFLEDLFKSGTEESSSSDPDLELRQVQFKSAVAQMMKVVDSSSSDMNGQLSRIRTYLPFCDGPNTDGDVFSRIIGNKCITRIQYCVKENGAHYFIGPFYQTNMASGGKLLEDFKKSSFITKKGAFYKISEILSGLHIQKGFHLDIRPRNIIIERFDEEEKLFMIKLPEQGIKGQDPKTPIFDPASKYIAPENIPGMTEKTQKADIFSLTLAFLVLMSSEVEVFANMKDTCFSTKFDDNCHKQLMTNVQKIFTGVIDKESSTNKKYIGRLKDCFTTALLLSPSGRQSDLKAYSDQIFHTSDGRVAI